MSNWWTIIHLNHTWHSQKWSVPYLSYSQGSIGKGNMWQKDQSDKQTIHLVMSQKEIQLHWMRTWPESKCARTLHIDKHRFEALTTKCGHITGVAPRLLYELLINSLDFIPSDRTNRARPISQAYGPINFSPGPCLSQYC